MARDKRNIGACPKCGGAQFTCGYNHFERDDGLVIDSWEHRCTDCGFRETTAYRSDEDDWQTEGVDPAVCPYCGRGPS